MSDNMKTFLEEVPLVPHPFVARLMSEIKDVSGLTHEKLADELAGIFDDEATLSGTMIAQYISGRRTMGLQRLCGIAQAAKQKGWFTQAVEEALLWGELFETDEYSSIFEKAKSSEKEARRDVKATLKKIDKAIKLLAEEDWSDNEIVALAILLAEKYISQDRRIGGGLLDSIKMRLVKSICTCGPVDGRQWLTWSLSNKPEDILTIPKQ